MTSLRTRRWAGSVVAGTVMMLAAAAAGAQPPPWHLSRGGLALDGYDAVAYFTDSLAVKGSAEFEIEWSGARWRFASAAARDAFQKEPRRYAPQFGGYCAYAVSRGYTASGDPQAWSVVNGKLYLNYSRSVKRLWERNTRENIQKGEANWPGVLK